MPTSASGLTTHDRPLSHTSVNTHTKNNHISIQTSICISDMSVSVLHAESLDDGASAAAPPVSTVSLMPALHLPTLINEN